MILRQYIVSKYVMAENTADALKKAQKTPVHECYVSNAWLEKVNNNAFYPEPSKELGLKTK